MFAGAAFTDEADIQAKDAVNMLTALGVIEGYEDGSFQPDGTVTRAEMAKMIFVVRNNSIDDSAYANTASKLTDIDSHWAKGYIKFCESQGIIAGKGNGIFDPDATVTGTEAAKMLLVLAGYEPSKAGLEGTNWATNTLRFAGAAGILDDVSSGLESGLPRQYAAQMIANTLEANRVKWSTDSDSFDDNLGNGYKETVGFAYMDLCSDIGVLVSINGDAADIILSRSDDADNFHKIADGALVAFTKIATDYSDLFGQKVKVMFKDGKTNSVLGVYAVSDNTIATANQKDVEVDAGKLKVDGVKYTLESNGVAVYIDGELEDVNYKAGDFENARSANVLTFIDSDGNNKIDTACIKTVDVAKVTYASSTQIIAGGKTYKYDEDTIDEGLAKDDWVIITENLYNENKDVVKAEVSSGKVEATKDKGGWTQYQIDGEWYNETTSNNKDINSNVRGGVDADFVAVNGILYYAHKTAGADSSLTNVLFVSYVGTNGLNDDQAKVMFPNGDKATITLAEKNYDSDWDGDFSDAGGSVQITNANAAGNFFEYTKSGSSYKLIALRAEAAYPGYYGDYTNLATLAMTDSDGNNTAADHVEKVDTLTIDDDADVILYAGGVNAGNFASDVKHVTGKQLKNLMFSDGANNDNDDAVETNALGAFSSKVNGITRATVLAVEIDNDLGSLAGVDVGGAYAHYGYVLDDAKQIDDYTIEFPMWNGETGEQITVQVAETNEANFTAGRAFGYAKMNTDENGVNTLVDVDPLNVAAVGSILEVDSKNPNKIVVSAPTGEIDLSNYTTVLYVNSKDKEGLNDVTATEANSVKVGGVDYHARNIMILGDLVVIDTIELATGVYENIALPNAAAVGVTSVQYVNNHTQKTDANAHVNSYLTVTVQAPSAGLLTLTDGLFVDTNTATRRLVTGENKFEVVITNNGFTMAFTPNNVTPPATGNEFTSAQDLAAALAEDDVTIKGTYPTGRTVTVPDGKTLTLDMVDLNDDVTIKTTGDGKVVLTNDAFIADTKTLTVNGTLEVDEDYTGDNVAGTVAADAVNYQYVVDNATVATMLGLASATGEVTVGNVTDALTVNADNKTLNIGTAMEAITVTTGTVNANALTAGKAVSVAATQTLTVATDTTLTDTDTVAGTLKVAGKLTTTGACAFTGDVEAETIEIGASYQVATGKKLTLTAATPAAELEKVTGQADTAQFIHAGSSDETTNDTTGTTDTAKFYSDKGTLVGSASSAAATVAVTSGKINAGTYSWNTTEINSNSDDITNNTTPYPAWLTM